MRKYAERLLCLICIFLCFSVLIQIPAYAQSDFEFYEYGKFYSINSNNEVSLINSSEKIYRRYTENQQYEYKTENGFWVEKQNDVYVDSDMTPIYTIDGKRIITEFVLSENGNIGIDLYMTEDGEEVIHFIEYGINGDKYIKYRTYSTSQPTYSIYVSNGNKSGQIEILNGISGEEAVLPECNFSPFGSPDMIKNPQNYKFKFWALDSNANRYFYHPGDTVKIPNRDITLYAIFEKKENKDTQDSEVINPTPFSDFFPIINQLQNQKSDSDKKSDTTSPSDTYTCPYTDISGHWAEDIIQFIDKLGLIDGITETEFRPDEPMTREMFVTAMARLAGVESDYVSWAINNGILMGYGNGNYGLSDSVTREQMAVFFLRFFDKMGIDTAELHVRDTYTFADDETISNWAADAVYEIQSIGLINGKENNLFDPKGTSTRAEAATVLYNLINTITEWE